MTADAQCLLHLPEVRVKVGKSSMSSIGSGLGSWAEAVNTAAESCWLDSSWSKAAPATPMATAWNWSWLKGRSTIAEEGLTGRPSPASAPSLLK